MEPGKKLEIPKKPKKGPTPEPTSNGAGASNGTGTGTVVEDVSDGAQKTKRPHEDGEADARQQKRAKTAESKVDDVVIVTDDGALVISDDED